MFYSTRKLEKIDEFAKVEQYLRRVENGWITVKVRQHVNLGKLENGWTESWTMDGSKGVKIIKEFGEVGPHEEVEHEWIWERWKID
jgi:hypothetical protein